MKRITYRFSSADIFQHASNYSAWHEFVRRREFELIMRSFPQHRFQDALELGAGDGGQSVTISRHCEKLTCTELSETGNLLAGVFRERGLPNVTYALCDATDLSCFEPDRFDLVFSSNMLEHIPNVSLSLNECRRVLREQGYMIHVMPSRHWKLWNGVVAILYKRLKPSVHGTASSNFKEWELFGEKEWLRLLRSSDLEVIELVRLPFYHGHGPIAHSLLRIGNKLSWNSSTAYICKKITRR